MSVDSAIAPVAPIPYAYRKALWVSAMVDEILMVEVIDARGVVDGPGLVGASVDGAKQLARERMAAIIDFNFSGDAVRLLSEGTEVYRWTRQDDALARAHAEHKDARHPGKRNA
jgi:hypothetical protein